MPLQFLSPIHRATRQIGIYMESRSAEFGVPPSEAHLLTYLLSYGPCPVGELHRVFGLKRSTLTSMLDRMERRGWIDRHVLLSDRRSFLVDLTPDGRSLADRLRDLIEAFEKRVMQEVDSQALAGFQAVMQAIGEVTRVTIRPDHQEESS